MLEAFVSWAPLVTILFSAGAVVIGVKMTASGNKERLTELKVMLDSHIAADNAIQMDTVSRLARMETKLDMMLSDTRALKSDFNHL